MPARTFLTIATVVAVGPACAGSPEPAATALPEPQVYAAKLDAEERYWWQQPEQVIALLQCSEGMTVVDLGAGTGYFLPHLSKAVGATGHVLALDVDPAVFDAMHRRVARDRLLNVRPLQVPADDPTLTPRSIDRVLVVNTWHHLSDRVEYAEKLLRAMRSGGRLVIVDFDEDSPMGPPQEWRLAREAVRDELRAAGFDAAIVEESLPYQYVVVGRVAPPG